MNCSIFSLSLNHISLSPFSSTNTRYLFKSTISNCFSTAFLLQSSIKAMFIGCSFNNFLRAPIKSERAEYSKDLYKNPISEKDTYLSATSCFFVNCTNDAQSGGAISCINPLDSFNMTLCEFYKCFSESSGGAVFIHQSSFTSIGYSCFHLCKSSGYGQTFSVSAITKKWKPLSVYLCSISQSENEKSKYVFVASNGRQYFDNCNVSFSKLETGTGFVSHSPSNLSVSYFLFYQNKGASVFVRKELPVTAELYKMCSFANNNALKEELFHVQCYAQADSFVFYSNKFSLFATVTSDSHFNMHECLFDFSDQILLSRTGAEYTDVLHEDCIFRKEDLFPFFTKTYIPELCIHVPITQLFTPLAPIRAAISSLNERFKNPHVFGAIVAVLTITIICVFLLYRKAILGRTHRR